MIGQKVLEFGDIVKESTGHLFYPKYEPRKK